MSNATEATAGVDNIAVTSCDCCAPSTTYNNANNDEEPEAVIKVLTLDWKAKDIINLMGPAYETHTKGKVKVEASTVTGFDTLFSEIENDARLGLGLFDVCE